MTSSLIGTSGGDQDESSEKSKEECIFGLKSETEPLQDRVVACVGPFYFRLLHNASEGGLGETLSADLTETVDAEDLEESEVEFEDDIEYLRSLDPKEWKNQDHYAVLGLRKIRIKATDEDIKRAYRQKVLKHHPDKRKAAGEKINQDDDYFTCITKAWEMLGSPILRRAFDSVDPEFDDDIPSTNEVNRDGFFKVYAPVFQRNAIWSENTPVPVLGNEETPRALVEKFYSFWFNFVSWREFSYHDDEEAKTGSDRDTRKWVEKQNKVARAKLKKEEMGRIRRLVENAYESDPRVQLFRQQDKESKLASKQARLNALQAKREQEEKVKQAQLEAERKEKEEKEREQKEKEEILKKQRDAVKNALRKEKKAFRTLCKQKNYFAPNEDDSVQNMVKMESICDSFSVDELAEVTRSLQGLSLEEGIKKFSSWTSQLEDRLQQERAKVMQESSVKSSVIGRNKSGTGVEWSPDDLQLLIKAVNLFPAGTNQRWEVVAEFLNQHSNSKDVERTAKEVLAKTKGLQSSDYSSLKDAANKKAYQDFEKGQKGGVVAESEASQRFDSPAEQQGMGTPWTAAEQQLLEQALRSFPASTAERWDRIAECVPTRSKKDCLRRYKELAEIVKAKKAAQAKVNTAK